MNMVERVAAAVEAEIRRFAAGSYGTVSPHARGTLSVDSEVDIDFVARAAIEAMREPTPLMLARISGLSPGGPSPSAHVLERWHSALDAALAP